MAGEGKVAMDEDKMPEQALENIKAINNAVAAYEAGMMSETDAGTVVYDRLFGERRDS